MSLSPQTLPRGLGSAALDDEGVPMRRKALVEQGVLRGFIFDRLWGARDGRDDASSSVGKKRSRTGTGLETVAVHRDRGRRDGCAHGS